MRVDASWSQDDDRWLHQGFRLLIEYRDSIAIHLRGVAPESWPHAVVEYEFLDFKPEGVRWPIHGRRDLLVRAGTTLSIVDFKTTMRDPEEDIARDDPQLILYAAQCHSETGELPERVRQIYFQRRTGKVVYRPCKVTEASIDRVMRRFRAMSNTILSAKGIEDFEMRPTWQYCAKGKRVYCPLHHAHRLAGPCAATKPGYEQPRNPRGVGLR